MDMQKYWGIVRQTEEGLTGTPPFYLTSNSTPDGGVAGVVVAIAAARQAAILLVGNSHRHATLDEIERFHASEKLAVQQLAEIEMKRKQQFAMPQDMQDLMRVAAENLRQQGDKKKEKA